MDNSSQDIRNSGLIATASLDYKISNALKASFTGSYSTNNTTQEIWHGEKSFYVAKLQGTSDEVNQLPQGGELIYQNTERYAYTVRGQLNFNKFLDNDDKHLVSAAVGGEISSNQYFGLNQTYRGYLKERGKKMASIVLSDFPKYQEWKQSTSAALGEWTDKLTNVASAYATVSYTYNNVYTLNANMRLDASNRFGSRANEKLAPIWSISARWDIKNDVLKGVCWVSNLAFLGSFGYQGNMLESQSAKLVLQREGIRDYFKEYYSTVSMYPNPDLKWEKTASYNATLDFGFFNGRIAGSLSYFYKKTSNAFLNKNITAVMGTNNWVVNDGVVENQGMELGLRFNVIDTKSRNVNGFRWTLNPNIGNVFNKVSGKSKDKSLASEVTYNGFLDGTIEVEGRPVDSFYSYKYYCLDATNGLPIFYASDQYSYEGNKKVNLLEKYQNMTLSEVCMDVMTYSGTRVPKLQGGIQNTFAWRRFTVGLNLTYSFGSKIRLLQMYSNVDKNYGTIAPQPTANVRKEFIKRWTKPGDELKTDVPGIVSSSEFTKTLDKAMWWNGQLNANQGFIEFADNLWTMYDKSDLRTVSGSFVKVQSLSIRYNVPDDICKRLKINSAYVGFSGTNLHTFCGKKLKGQDPATQDGTAPTINMSLRPTYSFNLNVSF